jgi:hypothetical protein
VTESRWDLPGPRRFADELAGALSAGTQLVIAAPVGLDVGALRRGVRDRSAGLMWLSGDIAELGLGCPLDSVLRWLDIRPGVSHASEERDLAEAVDVEDHVLWLDGYMQLEPAKRDAWREFLMRYARAVRRDADHRAPLFAITAVAPTPEDLTFDDPGIRLAYWWGALSRLDLATYIHIAAPEMPPFQRAVAVEVAGFDFGLADVLADTHHHDLVALEAIVESYGDARGMAALELSAGTMRCRPAEPGPNLKAWGAGQVDRFDGHNHLFVHSAACGRESRHALLSRRVWRGQITTLLPELEVWRTELIALAKSRGYFAADVESMDFGELHDHLRTHQGRVGRALIELAGDMRSARNRLAHLRHLSATTVSKLHADAERVLAA